MYQLADRLHKTLSEIEAMPAEEFAGWLAYAMRLEKIAKDKD